MTPAAPDPRVPAPLDPLVARLLDATGAEENRDLLSELVASVISLAEDRPDRLDLKIAASSLAEMRRAFRVFAPYRDVPKLTIFGSARTRPDDPLYDQARRLAAAMAARGWMIITGAGPGIMAAGSEGAGPENTFGINILLPFEQGANPFVADDKLVEMKYFFTRKLMLSKESDGFAVLPGGFGTLDEAFELFTLIQTGKAEPSPVVLVDVPGGTYWERWLDFVRSELGARHLIDEHDLCLFRITDDVDAAAAELAGFYRNYQSRRFVGDRLVLRLRAEPTDDELADLNRRFADIVTSGRIERTGPLAPEVSGRDHVDLPRVVFRFDRRRHARLRELIDALNDLPSAPAEPSPVASRDAATGGRPMEADLRAREDEEGEREVP